MVAEVDITELARRIENMMREGTIAEVDHAAYRCRVRSGNLTTNWLPFFSMRAGQVRRWSPPSVNEQCIVFSPGGDLVSGKVFYGFNSDENPAPESSPDIDSVHYPDGAVICYDHASSSLTATLPAGGTAHITAPGQVVVHSEAITLDAPLTTTTGALLVQGLLTWQAGMAGSGIAEGASNSAVIQGSAHFTDDVTAGDISLRGHHHQGVHGATGSAQS